MTVTVRLFAILRERAGRDSIEVELEEGATVAEASMSSPRPELGELLGRMPVRMAVNRDYADADTPLSSGDELALVPPVSGGEGDRVHVRITDGPLSLESLAGLVSRPRPARSSPFRARPAMSPASSTRPTGRWRRSGSRRSCASASIATVWRPRRPSTGSAPSRWANRA